MKLKFLSTLILVVCLTSSTFGQTSPSTGDTAVVTTAQPITPAPTNSSAPPPTPTVTRLKQLSLSRAMLRHYNHSRIAQVSAWVEAELMVGQRHTFLSFDYTPGPNGVNEDEIAAELANQSYEFQVINPSKPVWVGFEYRSTNGDMLFNSQDLTNLNFDNTNS